MHVWHVSHILSTMWGERLALNCNILHQKYRIYRGSNVSPLSNVCIACLYCMHIVVQSLSHPCNLSINCTLLLLGFLQVMQHQPLLPTRCPRCWGNGCHTVHRQQPTACWVGPRSAVSQMTTNTLLPLMCTKSLTLMSPRKSSQPTQWGAECTCLEVGARALNRYVLSWYSLCACISESIYLCIILPPTWCNNWLCNIWCCLQGANQIILAIPNFGTLCECVCIAVLSAHALPFSDSSKKPGPGAHCPEKVTIHQRSAPAPTLGIRHSEYICPLITDPSV